MTSVSKQELKLYDEQWTMAMAYVVIDTSVYVPKNMEQICQCSN